ncbi:MAG: hypothetical protein NC191_01480 [Muribaculaceae bacterium]|nr:hypothetical protein [Muribaculaceae bacterium]
MRRIFMMLSVIILLFVIYLAFMNTGSEINVNVLYSSLLDAQTQAGWTDDGGFFVKKISLALYTLLVLGGGLIVGGGTVYMFYDIAKDKLKAYQRELEKTAISGSNNASRVEVLEAKIKTLEKAFNTVIDERTQLEVQIKTLNAEIDSLNKK